MRKIYLDYNASTPIAPEVAEAMQPFLSQHYGNPSTTHWSGLPAKQAVDVAREQVARLLGARTEEIVFTSGGSESNNHVLKGVFYALSNRGKHIITSQIEHPAIINPCKFLQDQGAAVTYVGVDQYGRVSVEEIEQAITNETILISIMHANNEVGTIQPIRTIAEIARRKGILMHTDAAQSIGKIPVNVEKLGVDLLTVAGHKLYAPKGIGALYIKTGTPITPFIHGAGHEQGRRAGTENVLLIAGLGQAAALAIEAEQMGKNEQIKELTDYLWNGLSHYFKDQVVRNGDPHHRLPNTVSVSFVGRIGSDIAEKMPEIAVSMGSACHFGQIELSSVLQAMGVTENTGKGTIRFSLGRYTTKEEVDYTLNKLQKLAL
jgi:cysteine desulfurase